MNGAVDLPLGLSELSFEATGGARVRRSILPSGVRVLSERVPGSRSATIGYWVAVGSRDEQGPMRATPRATAPRTSSSTCCSRAPPTRTALDIAISLRLGRRRAQRASPPRSTPATTPRCGTATCRWPSRCSPTCSPRRCSTRTSSRTSAGSSSKSSRWPMTTPPMSRTSGSSRRCSASTRSAGPSAAAPRPSARRPATPSLDHYRANYRAARPRRHASPARVDHDELVAERRARPRRCRVGLSVVAGAPGRAPRRTRRHRSRGASPLAVVAPADRAGQHAARHARPRRRPTSAARR